MKEIIKRIAIFFKIPITKNLEYDILTEKIIKKLAKNKKIKKCVDVGTLNGDILKLYIKYLPEEVHYAFEPLPDKYEYLIKNISNMNIQNCALSDKKGIETFNYVKSNPSYSGLKQRKYPKKEHIEKIEVTVDKMDNRVNLNDKIDLIKIDVEGGEFGVLNGARNILEKDKPYLIFEFGLGASDFYGTTSLKMWNLLQFFGYKVFLLKDWLNNLRPLVLDEFEKIYKLNKEYYFIAEQR